MKPGHDGKLNQIKWPEDSFYIEDVSDSPGRI